MVTGSSSGIGQAIAFELARAGADVIVHAGSNQSGADLTQHEIISRGRESLALLMDLTEETNHEALVSEAWEWRNGIDIWINNAGADVLTGERAAWSFDDKLRLLWRVDVAATIRLSRLVGARMQAQSREAGSRVILNMGWDQAEQGMAGDSGEMFAAVKGAVMAFSRSLARSLAPEVRVNCLAPGWIKTAWGERASPLWQRRARHESLLGRWGTPEDVAAVARFLVSPRASFINGQVVPVNGGFQYGS